MQGMQSQVLDNIWQIMISNFQNNGPLYLLQQVPTVDTSLASM